jgi:hypothetical protein
MAVHFHYSDPPLFQNRTRSYMADSMCSFPHYPCVQRFCERPNNSADHLFHSITTGVTAAFCCHFCCHSRFSPSPHKKETRREASSRLARVVEMGESRTPLSAVFRALYTSVDRCIERNKVHFCLSTSITDNSCLLAKLYMKL